jgi:hypothetical protein
MPSDSNQPQYSLTLGRTHVVDFTDYLSLDGVALSFSADDLERLTAARDEAKRLGTRGLPAEVELRGAVPEVEFLGLGGLHEIEVDTTTVRGSGQIVIHGEVRHGEGEVVEVCLGLEDLERAA